MSAEVIGLYGPYEPERVRTNQKVIEELERLLEAAKSGDVVGLAGAYLHKDKFVSYSHAGVVNGYGILGGLECLKEKLLRISVPHE
ncbi:MAG TPA: hypothetical protein VIJ62_07660 [Rhizomicrobium sp.]|jgi:hypothetical protein